MENGLKGISIEILTPTHREGTIILIKDFFVLREPIAEALQMSWDEVSQGWIEHIDKCIEEGSSHVAVNGNNEVVGARLSRVYDVERMDSRVGLFDFISGPSEKSQSNAIAFNRVSENWKNDLIKSNGCPSKKLLLFAALCVRPDFGKRGIGEAMSKENLIKAKSDGCDYCAVVATNWMSQRVFEKCGFRTACKIAFDEYCNKEGEPVFDMKGSKNTCMKWMIKEL